MPCGKARYISFNDIKLWQWIISARVIGMKLQLIKGMRLVVATHNPGKAVEIDALLDGHYAVVTAASLNLPEPDETMVSPSELPAHFANGN